MRRHPPAARTAAVPSLAEGRIALHLGWSHQGRAADDLLRKCVAWTWRVKLSLSTERDLFARLRESAEAVAIKVFADNLRDLLLAAPAGPQVVMGLDPGIRTGVKVAVVDATGKLVDTATVFPHEPRRDWEGSLHTLGLLCAKARREPDRHRQRHRQPRDRQAGRRPDQAAGQGRAPSGIQKVVVSEAGASVYSASEFASQEMPDVDVSLRGAASIARRLQDPLAELVKIDPKSIGVGQYQHDVNQSELARTLDAVVEDCVNGVGVDLNTASVPLLSRVSGLSRHRGQGGGALARGQWRVQEPPAADGRDRPGRQDLRAERGIPAHPRRRQPAGHDRRAPGNLPGGRADHEADRPAGGRAHGPGRHAQDAAPRAVCERAASASSPSRTS